MGWNSKRCSFNLNYTIFNLNTKMLGIHDAFIQCKWDYSNDALNIYTKQNGNGIRIPHAAYIRLLLDLIHWVT